MDECANESLRQQAKDLLYAKLKPQAADKAFAALDADPRGWSEKLESVRKSFDWSGTA